MFERRQEIYLHLAWSTWDRAPLISAPMQAWLWPVLAEQARGLGCPWAVVGGTSDHVHLLCAMPTSLTVAALVQQLKGWTTRAANQITADPLKWQGGYGVFSVSSSDVPRIEAYVRNQARHHLDGTWQPEME